MKAVCENCGDLPLLAIWDDIDNEDVMYDMNQKFKYTNILCKNCKGKISVVLGRSNHPETQKILEKFHEVQEKIKTNNLEDKVLEELTLDTSEHLINSLYEEIKNSLPITLNWVVYGGLIVGLVNDKMEVIWSSKEMGFGQTNKTLLKQLRKDLVNQMQKGFVGHGKLDFDGNLPSIKKQIGDYEEEHKIKISLSEELSKTNKEYEKFKIEKYEEIKKLMEERDHFQKLYGKLKRGDSA